MSNKRILIKDGKALIDESGNVLVAENIGVEGATIKTKGTWQGTAVESGNVENVYLNTNLSVDEVVSIIENANLTYDDGAYMLAMKPDQTLIIGVVVEGGMCIITDFSSQQVYFHNVVGAEEVFGFSTGWNPNITMPIAINSEIMTMGENTKLTSLISTTPFTYQEGTPIELSGEYEQTTITITEKGTQDLINLIVNDKKIPLKIKGDFIDLNDFLTKNNFLKELESEKITTLRNSACAGLDLQRVSLPNLTSVSGYSFYDCINLSEVSMPNVTTIGRNAFYNCGFNNIDLSNVTDIWYNAFEGSQLIEVNLPNVEGESLQGGAFQNCTNLTNASLPKITHIKEKTFEGCINLTNVSMPNVVSIEKEAFSRCTNLSEIDLTNVGYLGEKALAYTNITTLTLPSIQNIGSGIKYMTKLQKLYFPNLESFNMATFPFEQCNALTDIYLGYEGRVDANSYFKGSILALSPKPTIHVKSAYLESYSTHSAWSDLYAQGKIVGDYTD